MHIKQYAETRSLYCWKPSYTGSWAGWPRQTDLSGKINKCADWRHRHKVASLSVNFLEALRNPCPSTASFLLHSAPNKAVFPFGAKKCDSQINRQHKTTFRCSDVHCTLYNIRYLFFFLKILHYMLGENVVKKRFLVPMGVSTSQKDLNRFLKERNVDNTHCNSVCTKSKGRQIRRWTTGVRYQ